MFDPPDGWSAELTDLIDVVERCRLTGMVEILHDVRDQAARSTCRVVFIGDFSAGKSTLVNTLLKKQIVDVGAVPTTTAVTVVHSENALSSLSSARSVTSDSTWLSRERIELVDTPGLGVSETPSAEREAVVSAAARAGDLIVLVTPGVGGFTLSDQRLLRRLAGPGRSRPPLVVVTMLTGPDDEEVLRRAKLMARRVNPAIAVLAAPGVDPDDQVAVRRRLRIKERITAVAREHHTAGYRGRALGESLAAICSELRVVAAEGLAAAAADDRRRAGVRERLAAERASSQALWLNLRIDLKDRADMLRTLIAERTRECYEEVTRSQLRRLRDSAEPGNLWADELAETIAAGLDRHELAMERLAAEQLLDAGREADERLAALARQRDPLDELAVDPAIGPALEVPRPAGPARMRSATTLEVTAELIAETGEALASLGLEAALPKSPAAEFTGLIGGFISVPLRKRLLSRQRAAVERAVGEGLRAWRDAYIEAAGQRISDLFGRLADAAQHRQNDWWQMRERIWAGTSAQAVWEGLLFETERIEKNLTERLRSNG